MRNIIKCALVILLLNTSAVMATPATDNSIKELLAITESRSLVKGLMAQIDASMLNSINESLKNKTPNAKQQEAITTMRNKTMDIFQSALAWENLEPMYIRIYKETLTEEEIVGIIAFYKTPAGQALIKKMPVVMQKLMPEIQKMSAGLTPQLTTIQEEFIADMKYAETSTQSE